MCRFAIWKSNEKHGSKAKSFEFEMFRIVIVNPPPAVTRILTPPRPHTDASSNQIG